MMTKQIKKYIEQTEAVLNGEGEVVDWEAQLEHHLVMTSFFQHERMIHLLITILFALLSVGFVLYAAAVGNIPAYTMVVITLVLLCFYIRHYFFLENRVQQLYRQYERMRERAREDRRSDRSFLR